MAIYEVVEAIVASGGTESSQVDIGNKLLVGLVIPTIDTGNITFKVAAHPTDTPVTLKNAAGSAIAVTAGTGGFAVDADSLTELSCYRWITIVCAVQSAARTFKWVLKG